MVKVGFLGMKTVCAWGFFRLVSLIVLVFALNDVIPIRASHERECRGTKYNESVFLYSMKKFTLPLNTYCLQLYTQIYVSRLKRVCSKRIWWSLTSTQGQKWLLPAPTLSSSLIWRLKIEVVCAGWLGGINVSREDHSLYDNLTNKQSTDLGKKRDGDLNLKFPPQSTSLLYLGTLIQVACGFLVISKDPGAMMLIYPKWRTTWVSVVWEYPRTGAPWCQLVTQQKTQNRRALFAFFGWL